MASNRLKAGRTCYNQGLVRPLEPGHGSRSLWPRLTRPPLTTPPSVDRPHLAGVLCLLAHEAGVGKNALLRLFGLMVKAKATVVVGLSDRLCMPKSIGQLKDPSDARGWDSKRSLHEVGQDTVSGKFLAIHRKPYRPTMVPFEPVHWVFP